MSGFSAVQAPKTDRGGSRLELRTPADGIDVSIVIVNWNTRDLLHDCIASLIRHTHRRSFEIIVVDNASADGSAAMVRRDFRDVILHANAENIGFAGACNQGMRAGRGRYFLLLNSDTRVDRDTASDLVDYMDRNAGAGMSGCALRFEDGGLQPSCGWFPSLGGAIKGMLSVGGVLKRVFDRRKYFARPFLSYADHARPHDVHWIVGACMMVRRECAADVGLMDDTIFLFAEEWDWCFRIKSGGWEIKYTPETTIYHVGCASWTMSDAKRVHAILSSQHYFYRKHYGSFRAGFLKVTTALDSALKSFMWAALWVLFLPMPARRAACARRLDWNFSSLTWCLSAGSRTMLTARDVETPASIDPALRAGGTS